jgi:hypothetical protein
MKKIAIVGDSHSAMLIEAWEEMKYNHPAISIDFYPWFSGGENSLIIKLNDLEFTFESIKIISTKSNILDISSYDLILVCGLGYSIRKVLSIYKQFRTLDHAESNFVISETLFSLAVNGVLEETVSYRLVKFLNSLEYKSIYVLPVPMGAKYLSDDLEDPNLFKLCFNNGDQKDLYHKFKAADLFFRENAIVLNQPLSTIIDWIFTDNFYSNASDPVKNKKYTNSRGKRDFYHMNVEYGKIVLESLFLNFNND